MGLLMAMAILVLICLLLPVNGSMQCTKDCTGQSLLFEQYCCVPNNNYLGKSHKIRDSTLLKLVVCPSTRPQICEQLQFNNCSDILKLLPTAESGYYNITLDNGNLMEVYCDMEGSNCGGEGGWMRVADINMTIPGTNCPEGLYMYDLGLLYPLCSYLHTSGSHCDSTIFPTHNVKYSSVCGRVRGYQHGAPDGIYDNHLGSDSIDSFYVDGVSITYGTSPRKHVWTFIGGQGEDDAAWEDCPCNTGSSETVLSFVGNDYYCESGVGAPTPYTLNSNDALWDGQQCNNLEAPCCTSLNLPYFKKDINEPISNDIEFRICSSEGYPDEATPVDIIELYVR